MPRVKLDQPVNTGSEFYGVTTCADLLDAGRAFVERVDNFGRNRITKYFVTLIDRRGNATNSCFEIGQKAFESRVAKGQNVPPKASADSVPPAFCMTDQWLALGDDVYRVEYDVETDSYEVVIPAHAHIDAIKILRANGVTFEYASAIYGESWLFNIL